MLTGVDYSLHFSGGMKGMRDVFLPLREFLFYPGTDRNGEKYTTQPRNPVCL